VSVSHIFCRIGWAQIFLLIILSLLSYKCYVTIYNSLCLCNDCNLMWLHIAQNVAIMSLHWKIYVTSCAKTLYITRTNLFLFLFSAILLCGCPNRLYCEPGLFLRPRLLTRTLKAQKNQTWSERSAGQK